MRNQPQGGFLIAKIHQAGQRVFAKKLKVHNISEINPAQGRIMFVLWREGEIPIRELARKTSLEKSTLTSMLDRLEKTGFIERVPSKDDRRKIIIRRTEKDNAFQSQYVQVSREMGDLFYRGFTEQEVDRFEKELVRILDNLDACENALKRRP